MSQAETQNKKFFLEKGFSPGFFCHRNLFFGSTLEEKGKSGERYEISP